MFIYIKRESSIFRFYRYVERYISGSYRAWAGVFFCGRPILGSIPYIGISPRYNMKHK